MLGWDRKIRPEDHRLASRVMIIGDREGRIFLSHPHTHDDNFFLLTTKMPHFILEDVKRLPENPEFSEMRHGDVILTLQ